MLFSTAEALLNKITKGEVKETVEEGGNQGPISIVLSEDMIGNIVARQVPRNRNLSTSLSSLP